ncbi:LysR family transcriptional regulator [Paenibacillus alvei]|nr:LysR family transcriptional regulator [Paenibacillus alvei]NEZ41686.1 LysR family transcriptional regulator [Paenibacillus alvei]
MMLDKLDGRQIATVWAVAQARNISQAAEQLGYVQSTVTSHVQSVEKIVGHALFHRLPRGVELTEAGAIFMKYIERWQQLNSELSEELLEGHQLVGEVAISILESFCTTRMPAMLKSIFRKRPGIKLQLIPGFMDDTCHRVLQGECELGIVPCRPQMEGVEFVPLVRERMVWVVSVDMRSQWDKQGWEAFETVRVIGFGPQCAYQTMAFELLQERGLNPIQYSTFHSMEMMKQTIKLGLGMALLPYSAVWEEVEQGDLECLPLREQYLTHGLIWKQGDDLSPAAISIRDILVNRFMTD